MSLKLRPTMNVQHKLNYVLKGWLPLLQCPIDPISYPQYTVINEYTNGGYNYIFIEDSLDTSPDLTVYIDRDTYTNAENITLTIQQNLIP